MSFQSLEDPARTTRRLNAMYFYMGENFFFVFGAITALAQNNLYLTSGLSQLVKCAAFSIYLHSLSSHNERRYSLNTGWRHSGLDGCVCRANKPIPGRHCAPSRTPGDSLMPVGGQEQICFCIPRGCRVRRTFAGTCHAARLAAVAAPGGVGWRV